MGKAALAVAASLPHADGAVWVFPPEIAGRKMPYGGLKGAWRVAMAKAGLEEVTPHTLRHSFASVAGDLGFSESTIGAMLGHAAGTVTGRYTHHLDAVLIAAADKVAAQIDSFLTHNSSGKVSDSDLP
jgi:integrase